MKNYRIKEEYLDRWGEDVPNGYIVKQEELERLAREWEIPVEELLEQLEEVGAVTRMFKVFGRAGHRQKESFNSSYKHDFSRDGKTRIIEVLNSDMTGTNDYTLVIITRDTAEECMDELNGQISDGIFENCGTGHVYEVFLDGTEKRRR